MNQINFAHTEPVTFNYIEELLMSLQQHAQRRQNHTLTAPTPSVCLWLGVLRQAMEDVALPSHGHQHPPERPQNLDQCPQCKHRDALYWFRSPSYEPASFLWLCEELGLETDMVLREVRARLAQRSMLV